MTKYSFFLLLLLISFRLVSSEIEVINLHENKSLDQMVLENVSNVDDEINVETNENSENNIENIVVESNNVIETELEYTNNFITQNDSSLINSLCQVPSYYNNLYFKFEDLILTNPHSIFYFKNKISFSGTMWENLKEFKID